MTAADAAGTTLDAHLPATPLGDLVRAVADAVVTISGLLAGGTMLGTAGDGLNVQGEVQQRLDVAADDALLEAARGCPHVTAYASEEQPAVRTLRSSGAYVLLADPLDGSSNLDVNVGVGTIFSVLPAGVTVLRPGTEQVCAGFAIYGPATVLVLSTGDGVDAFTLEPGTRTFRMTHRGMRVPRDTDEFAVNTANERFWPAPVHRYIAECRAGSDGPRGRDTNTRWVASLVADAYRILVRGGVFLYPADDRPAYRQGRLRLLYECAPIAFLMAQAGGAASDGRRPLLPVTPGSLHQRVPLVFGSAAAVERVDKLHHEYDRGDAPAADLSLFNTRSLYRAAR